LNPFAEFYDSEFVSDISTEEEAYQKGWQDGSLLKEMGFSLNFAPVVDLNDNIWCCRSFFGDEQEVTKLAEAYISGLKSVGILSTAKHYPGRTLSSRDPHKQLLITEVEESDLYPFQYLAENNLVDNVMVSHQIVSGVINSNGIPSVVSAEVIVPLKEEFSGLIISDDVTMLGLRKLYPSTEQMYIDLINAGNDMIINFYDDANEIYRMIYVIKSAVKRGEINEEQIDASVRKILQMKGFVVN